MTLDEVLREIKVVNEELWHVARFREALPKLAREIDDLRKENEKLLEERNHARRDFIIHGCVRYGDHAARHEAAVAEYGHVAADSLFPLPADESPVEEGLILRPCVAWFANQMERKLREHDDRDGWRGKPVNWLMLRPREELAELQQAIGEHRHLECVVDESTDVANFAMMIADVLRHGGVR